MLSKKNRVRICASVLNSLHFENTIKFFPHTKYVTSACDRNEVSFRTPEAIEKLEQDTNLYFSEWMITCRATKKNTNEPVEYFISTAYATNKVFVFSWGFSFEERPSRQIFLENVSSRVNINLENLHNTVL